MLRGKHAKMGPTSHVPWGMIFAVALAASVAACGLGMLYFGLSTGFTK